MCEWRYVVFNEELFRRDVMTRNLTNGFLGIAHALIMCRCYDLCGLDFKSPDFIFMEQKQYIKKIYVYCRKKQNKKISHV